MPLYEYRCEQCGRLTEKIQKFSDPELTVCPYCGGALARTLTAAAVHFSGGGWYKDLYSSAKPPAAGGSEKPASGSEGSGDQAGTPAPAAGAAAAAAPSVGAAATPAATPAPPAASSK